MAVQFQSYISETPWLASEIALLVEDAFVDAGLMVSWYDSFLSGGVENRILRIEHDATKTFGSIFYWFMFTSTRMSVHIATGWDEVAHVPAGFALNDYFSTSTNTTDNHHRILGVSNTVTFQVVRYTSTVNPNYTWFLVKNGGSLRRFHIYKGLVNPLFCDLDRQAFWFMEEVGVWQAGAQHSVGSIQYGLWLPRTWQGYTVQGSSASRSATNSNYADVRNSTDTGFTNSRPNRGGGIPLTYGFPGLRIGANTSPEILDYSASVNKPITLPFNNPGTNPNFATFESPLFTELIYSPYVPEVIPSDFAWATTYQDNVIGLFDKYIITPGISEWEVLSATNYSGSTGGAAMSKSSTMFLARTT